MANDRLGEYGEPVGASKLHSCGVNNAMQRLSSSILDVGEQVSALHGRLDAMLVSAVDTHAEPARPEPVDTSSPMAQELKVYADRLNDISKAIDNLLTRLDM